MLLDFEKKRKNVKHVRRPIVSQTT